MVAHNCQDAGRVSLGQPCFLANGVCPHTCKYILDLVISPFFLFPSHLPNACHILLSPSQFHFLELEIPLWGTRQLTSSNNIRLIRLNTATASNFKIPTVTEHLQTILGPITCHSYGCPFNYSAYDIGA